MHWLRFEENGVLPLLFPTLVPECTSIEDDDLQGVGLGCCIREFEIDMAVCGRFACAEGGLLPKPTLLEKELLETLRADEPEAVREETDEEKDGAR